jgi:hypothetical protein
MNVRATPEKRVALDWQSANRRAGCHPAQHHASDSTFVHPNENQ